jgi:hypothetical protein
MTHRDHKRGLKCYSFASEAQRVLGSETPQFLPASRAGTDPHSRAAYLIEMESGIPPASRQSMRPLPDAGPR